MPSALLHVLFLSLLFNSIINPLSPNSDQHQFSPNNIHRLSREMVMRIYQMITKEKMHDLLLNSLNLSLRKRMNVSLKNLYVDIGA